MKYIKLFREHKENSDKIFESSLPNEWVKDVQLGINDLLSEERFQPHINQENRWIGGMRKFNVAVAANESKFGIHYDVYFRLDEPVDIHLVNDEIKNCWRDIMDAIMDRSRATGQIQLTKFEYFGYSAVGKKDGHTKQIEDVTDKLIDSIDLAEIEPKPYHIYPILLQFTVSN
jgi:hypothetical protein